MARTDLHLVHYQLRLGGRQVDLVDYRNDEQALGKCEVDVGKCLRLDALRRVDDEDRALARLQAAADLVAEIDVAGRVDQVERVALAVVGVVFEANGARLDGDAVLALQVHRVQHLAGHLPRVDRVRQLEQSIGQRRLAVVDVGDDREVAHARLRNGHAVSIRASDFGRATADERRRTSDGGRATADERHARDPRRGRNLAARGAQMTTVVAGCIGRTVVAIASGGSVVDRSAVMRSACGRGCVPADQLLPSLVAPLRARTPDILHLTPRGFDLAHSPRGWTGARTPSAIKRVRQTERRRAINQPRRSQAKTLVNRALEVASESAANGATTAEVELAVQRAVSSLDLAAKNGAIHRNAAARRKSRLMRKVNAALGGEGVVAPSKSARQVGKAAAAKQAKARIAAGRATKAKGAQTAAGKARAALARTSRSEGSESAGLATTAAATATAAPTATKSAKAAPAKATTKTAAKATPKTAAKSTTKTSAKSTTKSTATKSAAAKSTPTKATAAKSTTKTASKSTTAKSSAKKS